MKNKGIFVIHCILPSVDFSPNMFTYMYMKIYKVGLEFPLIKCLSAGDRIAHERFCWFLDADTTSLTSHVLVWTLVGM